MSVECSGQELTVSACDVIHLLYGGLGGQHRLVVDLAAGFARAGLRSGAIAYGPEAELIPADGWPGLEQVHLVPKWSRLDRAGSRAIGRLLAEAGARALVWHSGYAALGVRAALGRGRLVTAVFVEHQSVGLRPAAENLRSLAGNLVAPRTVVLSETYRRQHPLRRLHLLGLRSATVVPNGVDAARFRPSVSDLPTGRVHRFVVVGRLVASRDVEVAVRASGILADRGFPVDLEIVGDGPERRSLLGLVDGSLGGAARGADFRFAGHVPGEGVADHLRAADVYLHPSLGEARSTALLQAWATGLPVVAARVTGIDDLVRDGEDGLLVPPSDPVGMADAVQRLLEDGALAARLGAAGRARAVAEFSLDATVRGYLGVLADADPAGPWLDALGRVAP